MTPPTEWRRMTLADVCSLRAGAAFKPALQGRISGDYPFIKVRDFNSSQNLIKINGADNWVSEADIPSIYGKPFPAGTSVFAKIGEALKHNRVRLLTRPTYIDNNLMGALPKTDLIIPEYLFHTLRTFDFSSINAGTAVPYLTAGTLGRSEVFIPPIETQCRIASILSAYDALIEVNLRRIAVLEEMARRLFDEWFCHFRFQGSEKALIASTTDLPEGWHCVPFGSLATEVRDAVAPNEVDSSTPYVGLEHIPRRSTTLTDWGRADEITSLKLRFNRGDVLFGKIRPYFHKVAWAPFAGISSSDAIIFRSRSSDYAALVLAVASSDQFVAHSVQTSNGTKMPRANSGILAKYPVPLPPDALLRKFNNVVLGWVKMAATLNAINQHLVSSRDLLIPRLISGELPIAVAESELETAA